MNLALARHLPHDPPSFFRPSHLRERSGASDSRCLKRWIGCVRACALVGEWVVVSPSLSLGLSVSPSLSFTLFPTCLVQA